MDVRPPPFYGVFLIERFLIFFFYNHAFYSSTMLAPLEIHMALTPAVLRQYTHLTWTEAAQQLFLTRNEMSIVCRSCGILQSEWKQNKRKRERGGEWKQPPPPPPPPLPLPCAGDDELPLFDSSMSWSAGYNDHDHALEGNADDAAAGWECDDLCFLSVQRDGEDLCFPSVPRDTRHGAQGRQGEGQRDQRCGEDAFEAGAPGRREKVLPLYAS